MKNIEERLYEKRNIYICINANQDIFYVIKDEIENKKYLITKNELKELEEEPTTYMALFELTDIVYGTDDIVYGTDKDKNNYLTKKEAIAVVNFLDTDLIRETFLEIIQRMKRGQVQRLNHVLAEVSVSKQKKKVLVQK